VRGVSDEQRKGESSEREDEDAAPKEDADDASSDDTGSDEESSEDERTTAEESSEDEDEPEARDDEGSQAAKRVATALGVDDAEQEEDKGEEGEEAAAPNRAARRAEAAQRRKKRKQGAEAAKPTEEAADEPLPKDKNARAKELLKRRREQAASPGRSIQLLPGEMVDDALARGSSAIGKWIRQNWGIIQWVIVAAVAAGGGFLFYQSRVDKKDAKATAALMAGVSADRGRVMAEDKRSEEEKEADPSKVFKTAEDRTETAMAAYKRVIAEHGGTAAAVLARLGEAGDYLDKQDYAHALEGFSAVSSSTLAAADPDLKGRALEGLGFAKEGKGDVDGALATFKELEGVDARGYKELGLYHQGRIWLAKGDKDKAKDYLKQAHDKLEQPTTEGQAAFRYLQQMTDETLRRIDPGLVPNKAPAIGGPKGGAMTADEIEKLKRQLMEQLKQKEHH
jgi:predicted negative regulator of RcsB-dependent stress response